MTWWEGAILGAVQGLTEFLPVSSSGHLVLGNALLGVRMPGVIFEATVHAATLVAVVWAYRARIAELVGGLAAGRPEAWTYTGLLALASVPAGAVGLLAREPLEAAFERPVVAAALLFVTGALVYSVHLTAPSARKPRPGVGAAVWIGLAQAAAILPGISRSGVTVAAGTWKGVEGERMAEFSFLLSVPAIGAAAAFQLVDGSRAVFRAEAPALVAGLLVATVVGVAAIRIFVRALEVRRFHWFAYYCWLVGTAYLVAAWAWPSLRG